MNLKARSSNRTYTMKDRRALKRLTSYQDSRKEVRKNKFFMKSIENLPKVDAEEAFKWESLREADRMGVNLETTQSKRNAVSCLMNKNSSQRMDMYQSQANVMVMPAKDAESPYIDSCMRQDLMTRSSCIKRATGKITVLSKIHHQFKTMYVYCLNNKYDYLETDGMMDTNGFACVSHSDLKNLPIGEEVDISQDSFLLQYPDQYNPNTDCVSTGYNARTIITTDWDNSGDSAAVSQSFMNRLTTLKTKTINIHLNNKSIKSKYPGKFPKLGEIMDSTILFKVCNDIGIVSELAQSAQMATGVEDDTIVVENNTYISGIEVYCNQPCRDTDLEKLRQETLDYRHKVYDAVAPLVENFFDLCSDRLKVLKENFSHDLFQVSGQELKYPYVKIKTVTIDVPTVGQKVSNNYAGKTTIQRVFPDYTITDELGRNIELVYPATAIVNRTVGGLLWEVFLSSFGDLLQYRVQHDEITPERTFEFVQNFMNILGISEEFNYSKFTPDSLYEFLKIDFMRIIAMPYSNNINLDSAGKLIDLAKEYLGYRRFQIFRGKKDKIPTTSYHTVGRLFCFRDMHDTQYGNSSCSTVEKNTKGFASDKDSSKRDGRALFGKKSVKLDVQNQHILLNVVTNETADIMINGNEGEGLYAVKENMEGAGLTVGFRINGDEEGSY